METKKIEITTLFVSLATILSLELCIRVLMEKGLLPWMVILGGARLLEIVLIMLIVLIFEKRLSSIGLDQSKNFYGFKRGLVWSVGFGLVVGAGLVVLSIAGVNGLALVRANLPVKPGEISLYFLIGGLVAPVAEEIFFRGIIYGFFRRWGVVIALVLTTLVFVLTHPIRQGFPITQVIGGILFALAYEVEGNLMVPITIHALGNIAIFTLSLVP